jgi:hypothetical protein
MSEAAYALGVVCEARADQQTACGLADRVLVEGIDWLEPEMLDTQRQWTGLTSEEPFLKWASVHGEVSRTGLKGFYGHFQGGPGAPDALVARKALMLFAGALRRPAAVLLVRDSDNDPQRRVGLEQARRDRPWPFEVIIGVAEPKRECWVLAGFKSKSPDEAERLRQLQERLSFHPVQQAHRLTARTPGAKTDAKDALGELTQGEWERECACWKETPLSELEQHGRDTGLAAYLQEVRERLVPVLGGQPSQQQ